MNIYRQIYYTGRVQGVGFRYSVKQIASGYEVIGWVRNLPDGRVEMQVGGEPKEVQAFLDAITDSHLASHIKQISPSDAAPLPPGSKGFEIRH